MYLCDECREEKYTNRASKVRSFGPCELCDQHRECSIIARSALQARKRKKMKPMMTG